jgi:hypothetical protein
MFLPMLDLEHVGVEVEGGAVTAGPQQREDRPTSCPSALYGRRCVGVAVSYSFSMEWNRAAEQGLGAIWQAGGGLQRPELRAAGRVQGGGRDVGNEPSALARGVESQITKLIVQNSCFEYQIHLNHHFVFTRKKTTPFDPYYLS